MAIPVLMPRQGQSVESCILGQWYKSVGEEVSAGDILFSYETDKASFEEEAKEDGILLATFFEEGDEVPVLVNVAVLGNEGESIDEFSPGAETSATPASKETTAETLAELMVRERNELLGLATEIKVPETRKPLIPRRESTATGSKSVETLRSVGPWESTLKSRQAKHHGGHRLVAPEGSSRAGSHRLKSTSTPSTRRSKSSSRWILGPLRMPSTRGSCPSTQVIRPPPSRTWRRSDLHLRAPIAPRAAALSGDTGRAGHGRRPRAHRRLARRIGLRGHRGLSGEPRLAPSHRRYDRDRRRLHDFLRG